jgi:hypothetical protein
VGWLRRIRGFQVHPATLSFFIQVCTGVFLLIGEVEVCIAWHLAFVLKHVPLGESVTMWPS